MGNGWHKSWSEQVKSNVSKLHKWIYRQSPVKNQSVKPQSSDFHVLTKVTHAARVT